MSRPAFTTCRGLSAARVAPRLRQACCRVPFQPTPFGARYASNVLNEMEEAKQKRGFKISHLFGGLVGLGMLVTIYGLLEYYFSLGTWPPAIRTSLRAALKARNAGDYDRSEKYFREAIDIALSLSPSDLDPKPWLKLTGLYVELAALLESQGQVVKAYLELLKAKDLMDNVERPETPGQASEETGKSSTAWNFSDKPETQEERVRRVGLLQKIGHLSLQIATMPSPPLFPTSLTSTSASAKTLKSWDASAEFHLNEAMNELLSHGSWAKARAESSEDQLTPMMDPHTKLGQVFPNFEAAWGNLRGFGITMEALGEVFARKGDYPAAIGCLLQAVDSLVPPQREGRSSNPSTSDICQAALLMTTISSYLSYPKTSDSLKQSRSFALQSLEMADQAIAESKSKTPLTEPTLAVCQRARAVGLFNMGMLAESQSDLPNAMKYFTKSLVVSRESRFSEGKRQANEAIRRVKDLGGSGGGSGFSEIENVA